MRSLFLIAILALIGGGARAEEGVAEGESERAEGEWTGPLEFGGSIRLFLFEIVDDSPGRNDFERGALRLTLERDLAPPDDAGAWSGVRFELHGVLSGTAPPTSGFGGSTGTGEAINGHRRIDLETDVLQSELRDEDIRLWAEIDRLNVRFEHRNFSLTAGRQPITWGVNYFWPVLDLFGPFSPAAVDRDYKPGVDALRLNLPLGDFSAIEVVAAAQGDEATPASVDGEEWSHGALGRFHAGGSDFGLMLGRFYRDDVAGAFVTGDLAAFGLRGEVLHTDVAREWLGLPGETQSSFWRVTLGVDRLLSPRSSLVTEVSWNGYGGRSPADYPEIAASRRVRRGEITSVGREYSGISLSFQATPLLTAAAALLTNWGDESSLLQPSVVWSLSDNATLTFGAFVGWGDGLDAAGLPGSEYGAVPVTLWGAVKSYF